MKFERPIAFLDLETTGVNVKEDRIVEIAILRYDVNKQLEYSFETKVNPEIPIPESASAVHGIYDKDVESEPPFSFYVDEIFDALKGCDIAGFNSNRFDFPMLFNEFARNGVHWDHLAHKMIDVGNIYKINEQRTLAAAVKFYIGEDLVDAHSALADTEATARVFFAQLEKYPELPQTSAELDLYCNFGNKRLDIDGKFVYAEDGETILINFSDKKGQPAKDHPGLMEWMLSRSFSEDTKAIAMGILRPDEIDWSSAEDEDGPF